MAMGPDGRVTRNPVHADPYRFGIAVDEKYVASNKILPPKSGKAEQYAVACGLGGPQLRSIWRCGLRARVHTSGTQVHDNEIILVGIRIVVHEDAFREELSVGCVHVYVRPLRGHAGSVL